MEKLTLTLASWRLPFSELRWGRFWADREGPNLVWIWWRSSEWLRAWLWSPGEKYELDENRLEYSGSKLEFPDQTVLRAAPLPGAGLLPRPSGRQSSLGFENNQPHSRLSSQPLRLKGGGWPGI